MESIIVVKGRAVPTEVMTKPPVKLAQATEVGQAVTGTSSGSVYLCCALHDHFAVAVRDKQGGSMSLRIESTTGNPIPVTVANQLKEIGFTGNPESHLSQHFNATGGALIPAGAYGAVMEQLRWLFGADKLTTLPYAAVKGKGT